MVRWTGAVYRERSSVCERERERLSVVAVKSLRRLMLLRVVVRGGCAPLGLPGWVCAALLAPVLGCRCGGQAVDGL